MSDLSPTGPDDPDFPHLAGHAPEALFAATGEDSPIPSSGGPLVWEPPAPEVLGELLEHFEVSDVLGRGGMGAVYRATQTNLAREVAIKLLPPELASNPEFDARFQREARAMAQLNHPNIVQVYDFGRTRENHCYIVMEFVEGTDLHQFAAGGNLPVDVALNAVSQICDALQYAHEKGFVHRDIKPANIFLNQEGVLKIGDFGLAKLTEESGAPAPDFGLTSTGFALGTPDYVAPEQLTEGEKVDRRADIYSLGVMFYQLLTGELPRGAVRQPSSMIPALDVRIDGIVYRAMESDREARYQQASDIRNDIDGVRTSDAHLSSTPQNSATSSKKAAYFPVAIGFSVLVILAALVAWFRPPLTPSPNASIPPEAPAESTFETAPTAVDTATTVEIPEEPFLLPDPTGYPPLPETHCRLVTILLPDSTQTTAAFENAGLDDFTDLVKLGNIQRLTNVAAIRADGSPVLWRYDGGRIFAKTEVPAVAVFNNVLNSKNLLVWVDRNGTTRSLAHPHGIQGLTNIVHMDKPQSLIFAISADGGRHLFGDTNHPNLAAAFEESDMIAQVYSEQDQIVEILKRTGHLYRFTDGRPELRAEGIARILCKDFAATTEGTLTSFGRYARFAEAYGERPVHEASKHNHHIAIRQTADSPWEIWHDIAKTGNWQRDPLLERAIAPAIEVRVQAGMYLLALIPHDLIPRSGIWDAGELAAHFVPQP